VKREDSLSSLISPDSQKKTTLDVDVMCCNVVMFMMMGNSQSSSFASGPIESHPHHSNSF
jgi:hypothetical protein